jgi:hypothetical protein
MSIQGPSSTQKYTFGICNPKNISESGATTPGQVRKIDNAGRYGFSGADPKATERALVEDLSKDQFKDKGFIMTSSNNGKTQSLFVPLDSLRRSGINMSSSPSKQDLCTVEKYYHAMDRDTGGPITATYYEDQGMRGIPRR